MFLNKINVMYINLERRTDRKLSVINELKKNWSRKPLLF